MIEGKGFQAGETERMGMKISAGTGKLGNVETSKQ